MLAARIIEEYDRSKFATYDAKIHFEKVEVNRYS